MEQEGQRQILGIALVICRNAINGKYLSVLETNNKWWVPGGRVDAPEAFTTGAVRECMEEAGIDLELKGILRIEQAPSHNFNRLKSKTMDIVVVFYGEPKDPQQAPKSK